MRSNKTVQLWCAYMGYPFFALFLIGFGLIAGFVIPISPAASARHVASLFAHDATRVRAGMLLAEFGVALILPWQAAIAIQVRRIEGRFAPLTILWIMAAALLCIEFFYPLIFWMVTSFRPGSDPQVVRAFNDLSWIALLAAVSTAVVQVIVIGIATLLDHRPEPVYPRWFGYFSVWSGLAFVPAGMIIFFKHGAFAWSGFMAWYVVLGVVAIWLIATTVLTVRAIHSHERELERDAEEKFAADLDRMRAMMEIIDSERATQRKSLAG